MTPDRDTAFDPVRLPRRNLLRSTVWTGVSAASLGLITGCDGSAPDGRPSPKPKPDPDLPVVTAALGLTRRLLDLYAATTARHPGLKEPLAAYVKRHQAHAKALADGSAGPAVTPSPTASAPASASASATPTAAPVAGSPGAAVRALISLEASAAEERSDGVVRARHPELARLLASIGACEALHALALGEVVDG